MIKGNFYFLMPRRPAVRAGSQHRQFGFSLVELMIAIVLLAIGTALSLPSYREMVEKRQITHGAEQIMAFVNSAQLEAMKQNSIVTVSYSRTADDDWCFGSTLGAGACDCTETDSSKTDFCAIDTAPRILTNQNVGNTKLVKSITGDGAYSIDPVRGIFVDLDDSLVVEMRSNDEQFRLDLEVNKSGQATLCSKDSSHSVPGYKVCP